MPFKIKIIKFISSLLLAVFFIQNTTAQKIKIDAVGVVVGKNIVLDSDIEKFKLELENNSELMNFITFILNGIFEYNFF